VESSFAKQARTHLNHALTLRVSDVLQQLATASRISVQQDDK
jgi:hypothetical protein